VAAARGQPGNLRERECLPLEAITKRTSINTQSTACHSELYTV
jgi:hypothetical protein